MPEDKFSIAVIGGGHAGCEAAWAAASLGEDVLLVTSNPGRIGRMSCNPSIGGVAKGQLVREIDALGGIMGCAADMASIQFRMLNTSKGPAVRSPRSQSDRRAYSEAVTGLLDSSPRITVLPAMTESIIVRSGRVRGLKTVRGDTFEVRAVILAAGTFLDGVIRIGEKAVPAGREGDPASVSLAGNLMQLGLERIRFKTGTPPRLEAGSIDFSKLGEQPGDGAWYRFSHFHDCTPLPQVSCWHARTTAETRRLVMDNLERSSLYGGFVEGRGPRYCPSIEDKFVRFPDRDIQHLFLEPEGLDTSEIYLNGLSNSMPADVQEKMVRSVEGLENAEIARPGYAIEYDCYDPRELDHALQSRKIAGLYLAGQVNGTSGYEEAAGQGLAAGLNAARSIRGEEPVVFSRTESYLGVLIDDIVTQGVDEPYRLFSSRAEFRLSLRQDNADLRLSPLAHECSLISDGQYSRVRSKKTRVDELMELFRATRVSPDFINPYFRITGSSETSAALTLAKVLKRPETEIGSLLDFLGENSPSRGDSNIEREALAQVEMEIKYEGYMARERAKIDQMRKLESVRIPEGFDFQSAGSLSTESRQRLARHSPATLGQASRVPGLRPDDITSLMIELEKFRRRP